MGDCADCPSTGVSGAVPLPPDATEDRAVAALEELGVEDPGVSITDADDPQGSPEGVAVRSVTGVEEDVTYQIVISADGTGGTEVAVTVHAS